MRDEKSRSLHKKKKLYRRCSAAEKDCKGFSKLLCPVITDRARLMLPLFSLSLHNYWNVRELQKHIHKCVPRNNEAWQGL